MNAPTRELPSAEEIALLPVRSQIAFAIRCAQRAEPLYVDTNANPLRARFVRACIESATKFFMTGQFENIADSVSFNPIQADHDVGAAQYAVFAAEAAFNQENDPEYDVEEAEYDEATPAHRVECVASFSLLAVYDTYDPIDEARRCERIALAASLADFRFLTENHNIQNLADIGPLWQDGALSSFASRLERHEALIRS